GVPRRRGPPPARPAPRSAAPPPPRARRPRSRAPRRGRDWRRCPATPPGSSASVRRWAGEAPGLPAGRSAPAPTRPSPRSPEKSANTDFSTTQTAPKASTGAAERRGRREVPGCGAGSQRRFRSEAFLVDPEDVMALGARLLHDGVRFLGLDLRRARLGGELGEAVRGGREAVHQLVPLARGVGDVL